MLSIPIINESSFELPSFATKNSAGVDLRANLTEPVTLGALERKIIGTGLKIALPEGI
jgi:dUTP pyrophosphatase